MNKTHEISMPSKFVRYLLAAHNVLLTPIFFFLTELGKGGNIEKFIALAVIAFFILSVISLVYGSVGILGNDFWFTFAFHLIIAVVCIWMVISFMSKETQLVMQIFDRFNLKTAAYLYLIPGSLLSLWTALVFLNMGKAEIRR
jgi:hypothetical protein